MARKHRCELSRIFEEFVDEVEKLADTQEKGWAGRAYVPSDYMREENKNLRDWVNDARSALDWLYGDERATLPRMMLVNFDRKGTRP